MMQGAEARTTSRRSLDSLTGLRFFAALWVVIYHYILEFRFTSLRQEIGYQFGPHNPFDLLMLQGHLAVDFFFILSGFILAYTYSTAQGTLRGGPRAFWIARLARIYPVYLLGLLLSLWTVLSVQASFQDLIASAVGHVFLLHAWFPTLVEWNQPSWSLSVEAFFYALFPLLLPLFARCSRSRLWVLFLGSLLLFGVAISLLFLANNQPQIAALPGWRSIARYNPLISLPEFTAGMALGLLFIRRSESAFLARWRSARVTDSLVVVVAIILAAVLVGIYKLGIPTNVVDTEAPVALPLLAALIYLLAFQRGLVAWLLARPLAVWLGEISYGIYIVHVPIWDLLLAVAKKFSIAPGNVLLIPVYAVLILGVAGFSFKYIERPARRVIRARWGAAKPISVPSVPKYDMSS